MKYLKAAIVGLLASLVIFLCIRGLMWMGFAPFNTLPPTAFLLSLDLPAKPWGLLLLFLRGTVWSIVFVAYCRGHDTAQKGLGLALLLWIIVMLVYSPVIGWGLFGFAGTPLLDPDAPLFLQGGLRYPVSTLMLHLVYGAIIGWLNPVWRGQNPDEIPSPSEM